MLNILKKIENKDETLFVFLYSVEFAKKQKMTNFSGKNAETFFTFNKTIDANSLYFGIGKEEDFEQNYFRKIGNKLYTTLKNANYSHIAFIFNSAVDAKLNIIKDNINDDYVFNIIEGYELSDYSFDKYFSDDKKKESKIEQIAFVVNDEEKFVKKYNEFELEKENVFLCRDLVNEPSNILYPESYAKISKGFEKYGLDVEILDDKQMKKLGMECLLAVGQGSTNKPKLAVIKWQGLKKFENPIAFVGKGITFDSGGLCIKPDNSMYDMKTDMAGSAVVVSTLKLLAHRNAKDKAVGVVALVENMPSGEAVKPADIVKSMSGQTVEILHTDAEGRLILADALYYCANKFKPQCMIDLATLTGAICVALGEKKAGLFTNNDYLSNELLNVAEKTGESCWRMPLDKIGGDYDKMMDSTFADVKNISGVRYGGSITAAQFLQRFIDNNKKWAHIDIAGTSNTSKDDFFVKGNTASGFGVRLLNQLVKDNYEK